MSSDTESQTPLNSLRSFVGVSGTYNVADQIDHFDSRGLYKSLLLEIMDAQMPGRELAEGVAAFQTGDGVLGDTALPRHGFDVCCGLRT